MRVATWNLKQALAPRKPLDELWSWAEQEIAPDVAVFTEARVPTDGPPPGWSALWVEGGFGKNRRWGTVLAGHNNELVEIGEVRSGLRTVRLQPTWPAAVRVADVMEAGERWATVVGLYGLTVNRAGESCGHGRYSAPRLLEDLKPLFRSDRRNRIVVAGDFNMWPEDRATFFDRFGLVDLVDLTAGERPALEGCSGCNLGSECGHMWTHRNGNSPNARVQHIDFVLATEELAREVRHVYGGIRDFPDAWEVSDHAPVVVDFD